MPAIPASKPYLKFTALAITVIILGYLIGMVLGFACNGPRPSLPISSSSSSSAQHG